MKGHNLSIQALPEQARCDLEKMISRTKSKLIAPVLTAGILRHHLESGDTEFSEDQMRRTYQEEVCQTVRHVLGHNLHIGGDYEDAYCSRTLPKYGVVEPLGQRRYRLTPLFTANADVALAYIHSRVPEFVASRLGEVVQLGKLDARLAIAQDAYGFTQLLEAAMQHTPSHFEIVSFAVLRVHLEKFACKIYRNSRTSAHDRGVDIATDYGTVYQIKKMRLSTREDAEQVYSELLTNFDEGRLRDRKVVLVIDDISSACRQFLIDMRVQPLARADITTLAHLLADEEDRQKVLRVIHDEFEREFRSDICMACRVNPRIPACRFIPVAPYTPAPQQVEAD